MALIYCHQSVVLFIYAMAIMKIYKTVPSFQKKKTFPIYHELQWICYSNYKLRLFCDESVFTASVVVTSYFAFCTVLHFFWATCRDYNLCKQIEQVHTSWNYSNRNWFALIGFSLILLYLNKRSKPGDVQIYFSISNKYIKLFHFRCK